MEKDLTLNEIIEDLQAIEPKILEYEKNLNCFLPISISFTRLASLKNIGISSIGLVYMKLSLIEKNYIKRK